MSDTVEVRFPCKEHNSLFSHFILPIPKTGGPWPKCDGGTTKTLCRVDDQPDDQPPKGIWVEVDDGE